MKTLQASLLLIVCAVLVLLPVSVRAQTTNATVNGLVVDSSGGVVVGASVRAINDDTNVAYPTVTNNEGVYSLPDLPPGRYRLQVEKTGFKTLIKPDIILHLQDARAVNFTLQVGSQTQTVTVQGGTPLLNTESGTVSTVVNRQFLEDVPLNGRSLQTLLMLTPGVVFTEGGATNSQGQFSVNGMRTDANYFTVDGVAANLGTDEVGNGLPEAAAGSMPGFNALGGTNSLVSVDAIQEFRVQTSTFAPEYGRTPGAQVAIVTRSGGNAWHGTGYDYLRNDKLDANDWFANKDGLAKAEERQNDFGGVFGGPIKKDRTFFFFSYEGLRLRQPVTLQGVVPDATARTEAAADLQPYLNAYPIPNGPEFTDNLAGFNASISDPSTLNAYSIRVDHSIGSKLKLFGRYAYSPSSTASAGSTGSTGFTPNNIYQVSEKMHTFTLGLDEMVTNRINNELRLNYSNLKSLGTEELSNLGGAVPLSNATLAQLYAPGVDVGTAQLGFELLDASSYFFGAAGISEQRQINLVDNLSIAKGPHMLKFGVDFRYLAPFEGVNPYFMFIYFNGINGPGGVLSGQTEEIDVESFSGISMHSKNFSAYGEDAWKANRRLTLTFGLRWDVNPAPQGSNLANDPLVAEGVNDPATMTLAPRGTPFYATTWGNFAPRFAAAYMLRKGQGRETVLRGGIGSFYDLGSGSLGLYTLDYPFRASSYYPSANFPLTPELAAPPTVDLSGPVGFVDVAVPNLALPRTYQWNFAVEQSLGQSQTLSVTYLGALGRDLLREYTLNAPNAEFSEGADVTSNSGASNYQALQVKFQRQVSHGLQALASYTWSHSLDNASNDWGSYSPIALGTPSIDHGNSDFDVRHSGSAALTYDLPAPAGPGAAHKILEGWSVDDLLIARTAFPVDLTPFFDYYFIGPYAYSARPNVVPGVPLYLYGSQQYPGGKAFNPAAFTDATPGTEGDLARNTMRGFGMWQDNFALHRQFALTEKVNLQFRVEAFNIFNHPSFADPPGFWPTSFPEFGVSSGSLASGSSNSTGDGLNPLYQIGAARSFQFGLKLQF